ncbi:helix-turn-helix domain-containing protein [Rhodocyclus tenuis]|uniref:AraC-like DNA-binding protein n=1 Tax=Rhodocyclus tenuis TaxID=1066 RepID=A0A840GD77_RHOTE|nr:helix-turn-helix domain-containing protein [Rhodocyclus tenuis]MBB4248820.1 AraC-like DNA-binding protein [Rhodocyclus tenuis]
MDGSDSARSGASIGAQLAGSGFRPAEAPGSVPIDWEALGEVGLARSDEAVFTVQLEDRADEPRCIVLFQMAGSSLLQLGRRRSRLATGDFCLMPPARSPDIEAIGEEGQQAAMSLSLARLAHYCPNWRRIAGTPLPADRAAVVLLTLLRHLLARKRPLASEGRRAMGEAVIHLLATTLNEHLEEQAAAPQTAGRPAAPNSRLESYHRERIRNYVRTHLCEPTLDIAAIARGVDLSSRYIHKLFEGESMPLMQWVWELRLTSCYRQLAQHKGGRRNIGALAFSYGFNDQAHFSRAFKQRFGCPPREVVAVAPQGKPR